MKVKILQIKSLQDTTYLFMGYDFALRTGFTLDDYEEVWEGSIQKETGESTNHFLESVFTIFNIDRPYDFKGHSLSVSDLIRLEDGSTYYVDSIGFKRVA